MEIKDKLNNLIGHEILVHVKIVDKVSNCVKGHYSFSGILRIVQTEFWICSVNIKLKNVEDITGYRLMLIVDQ